MKKQKLIDADHLIESIKDGFTENSDYRHMFQLFVDFVDEEPTVDPVKHGHWIADRIGDDWLCYDCSECGNIETVKSNYCPWCGAKMD